MGSAKDVWGSLQSASLMEQLSTKKTSMLSNVILCSNDHQNLCSTESARFDY